MAGKASTAVAVHRAPTPEEMQALLQQAGMQSAPSSNFRRMKMDGGTLLALDASGEIEEQFPPRFKGKEPQPAVTLRIVEPPQYYNAFWCDTDTSRGGFDASAIGHPEINKSFVRKWDDEANQTKDNNPNNAYYAEIAQYTGKRGDFRGDLKVQIVPETGEMTGEETVYSLSLSASACLDWRGTSKNPRAGVVQDTCFIVQLAEKAVLDAMEAGTDPNQRVLDAMTALRLGSVVADVYLLRASNTDGSVTWTIPAFKPVHIDYGDETPALSSGEPSDDVGF